VTIEATITQAKEVILLNNSSSLAFDISSAAAEKKAKDIRILNVKEISPITDYFVICSGSSSTQVKAIADEIEHKISEQGIELHHKEGHQNARWILLDFGSVIAHVFFTEDREFYDLERLWADAVSVSI
jgi:ribosome-associated protein